MILYPAPSLPGSILPEIEDYQQVYYAQGSPLVPENLARVQCSLARAVIIMPQYIPPTPTEYKPLEEENLNVERVGTLAVLDVHMCVICMAISDSLLVDGVGENELLVDSDAIMTIRSLEQSMRPSFSITEMRMLIRTFQ